MQTTRNKRKQMSPEEEARKFTIKFNVDYYQKHKKYPEQHIIAKHYSNHVLTKKLEEVEEEISYAFHVGHASNNDEVNFRTAAKYGAKWTLKTLKEKTIFKQ